MPDLDFTIRTQAELSGAEQAAESLERLIGKQKALGEDYSENAAALDKVKASLANYTPALGDAGDATEGLTLKKRELLDSLRGVTRQFPILGEAARAIYNPIVASVMLIVGAFALWRKNITDVLDALGAIEMPDLNDSIIQAEKTATAWSGIATAVEAADTAFGSFKETYDRTTKAINAQLDAAKNLLQANKDLAVQQLDQQRERGDISPEEYAAKKAVIEQGFNDQTTQAEIDARNASLAAKRKQQQDADTDAKNESAAAAAIKLPQQEDVYKAQQDALQKEKDEAQKQADEHKKSAEDFNNALTARETGSPTERLAAIGKIYQAHTLAGTMFDSDADAVAKAVQMEQQSQNAAQARADAAAQAIAVREAEKTKQEEHQKNAEAAAGDAERMKKELAPEDDPNAANIPGTVAFQNAQARAAQAVRDQTAQIGAETDLEKARKEATHKKITEREKGPEGKVAQKDIEDATYSADLVNAGDKITDAQTRQMVAMAEIISGHAQTAQSAARVLESIKNSGDQMLALLNQILANQADFQNRLSRAEANANLH
jgi:hypothetical protein